MKRSSCGFIVGMIGLLFISTMSFADMIDIVNVNDAVRILQVTGNNTIGGPFNLVTGNTPSDSWFTFCLEHSETFSYGATYKVASIETYAEKGGGGASNGKDYLDIKTAFLYYHYRLGDLGTIVTGFDGSLSSQYALQNAIWVLETEITNNFGIDSLENKLLAVDTTGWSDVGNVRALNIVDNSGAHRQSQLMLVPEPSALLFLGASLLGLGFAVRRRKK